MLAPDSVVYDWFGSNRALFLFVNGIRAPLLDPLIAGLNLVGDPRMFPFYVATMLVVAWRRPASMPASNVATFAVSYALVSALIVPVMKAAFDFPRPAEALGGRSVAVLGDPGIGPAFPSGHAAFAVLTACSLLPGAPRRARIVLVACAVLVCIARVSSGAHFPADVVAGALIAAGGRRGRALRVAAAAPRIAAGWNR